jgi:hypothetical protein
MGFLLPQRRPLGNTFRDHSIFIERQDLPGEIRRSEISERPDWFARLCRSAQQAAKPQAMHH